MNIETKIRKLAAKKIRVKITSKKRSKTGFTVTGPGGFQNHLPNKKAALQNLLARLRCSKDEEWTITPTHHETIEV